MASEPQSEAGGRPTDAGSSDNHGHGVNDDRVRERAHQIWVEEGKPDGRALDHWLRAKWEFEQELDR
jgi:hypothetical protein